MEDSTINLIDKCRHADKKAQEAIYKLYASRIYIACLRITGNSGDAEEAMQDSFLKIFDRLNQTFSKITDDNSVKKGNFQNNGSFEAWIRQIAIHTAIDYVRRKNLEWVELNENYVNVPEDTDYTDEDAIQLSVTRIKEGMKHLPDGYRIILSLYLFEGYDMEEIASILHLQPASVRSQYLRGKRKLLNLIETNKYGPIETVYRR